ncbi:S-adenosylmethionine tRNA ribosyltransferase [Mycobacterium sp. MS1601]|uniref:DUF3253 domain-containing protein n=1 Tax=Mycobacterium sp. MS1601 TaxID=1936029 RepID=UPI0009795925|nr:DUF3253 domain-containing protein [Mycobacterium sp. MS1601]AQA05455.1 S-adenosylmethionine tRNA ribosyltransferase [Mycobacterium sp. MS1601]
MSGPPRQRLEEVIRELTTRRGPDSSICPSDAARMVGGQGWRELMDDARATARALARAGEVEITQGGNTVDPDVDWHGPVRIRTVRR